MKKEADKTNLKLQQAFIRDFKKLLQKHSATLYVSNDENCENYGKIIAQVLGDGKDKNFQFVLLGDDVNNFSEIKML